jgi:DNA primase
MNTKQAKQIPLEDILQSLGYEPAWENRNELVYHSPFREEKVPSFFLNTTKNVWHDFGPGEGGNVIDFIMTYYDITSVSVALSKLDALCGPQGRKIGSEKSTPTKATEEPDSPKPLHILKIQSLQNKVLLQYLKQRGISWQTASPYVKEIYYSLQKENQMKTYFALAFPN